MTALFASARRSLLLTLLLLCAASAMAPKAQAGPWPTLPGKYFFILEYYRYQTSQGTLSDGTRFALPNGGQYTNNAYKIYGEYGISPGWVLEGTTVFIDQQFQEGVRTRGSYGFSDLELSLNHHFLSDPLQMSARVGVSVPWLYGTSREPRLGFNQYSAILGLNAGDEIPFVLPMWWAADVNYRFYFGEASDQLGYEGTLGVHLGERLDVMGQVFGTHNMQEGTFQSVFNPLIQSGITMMTWSVSGIFKFNEHFSLRLSYFEDFYSENAGFGDTWSLSAWIMF